MRKILIIGFLVGWCTIMNAQTNLVPDIDVAFLQMPIQVCPLIELQQRAYLLDYAQHGSIDTIVNIAGGKAYLEVYAPEKNYIRFHAADGVSYEMLLRKDTLLLATTVCAPVCSSVVRTFYRFDWIELTPIYPNKDIAFPQAMLESGELIWVDNTPKEEIVL